MTNDQKIREKKWVALTSIVGALVITGLKLGVGLWTNSLGILSEAAHSGLDLLAAAMTYFAVSYSDRPADREHQFGHGKIENVSALFETLLLVVTCFWIIWEAFKRLTTTHVVHVDANIWGFGVIVISIIVDITRSRALKKVAKKYNSQALEADALHFSSDIWSSLVVLLGLVCVSFGYPWVDTIAALLVAALVLVVSYRLGKKTIDTLLDTSLPQAELDWLHNYLTKLTAPVNGYHGLRTRMSGSIRYIELHLEVEPALTVETAHAIAESVMKDIETKFTGASVIVHLDPYNDEAVDRLQLDS
ncbi:MAG: cation diffusion facilitator family transporter [bacterium]|nr:cation diffusion facilitator family transporter [bacterium]